MKNLEKIKNNINKIYRNSEVLDFSKNFREDFGMTKEMIDSFFKKNKKVSYKNINYLLISFLEYYLENVNYKKLGIKEYNINGNLVDVKDKNLILRMIEQTIDDFIYNENSHVYHEKNFNKICEELKINPNIWGTIFLARILNFPKRKIINFIPNIYQESYEPKISICPDGINIKINEISTIEDIKDIWSKVKKKQKEYQSNNNFKNQKKEYNSYNRDRLAFELSKRGYTHVQIHKKLLEKGYKSSGYDYISKMIKRYENYVGKK